MTTDVRLTVFFICLWWESIFGGEKWEVHDEGVEKHSCQIELRGTHVKLVHYNNKKVLSEYCILHVIAVLHVRSEDEHVEVCTRETC
jgi:hypothetical protein